MKRIRLLLLLCLLQFLSLSAQVEDFGVVPLEVFEEKKDPHFQDASAVILFRKVDLDYGSKLVVHERIKIYNSEAFAYSDWTIPFEDARSIEAATYNLVNGAIETTKLTKESIFVDEISEYEEIKKLAFPNVREGSVIEIKYTVAFIGLYKLYTQHFLPIRKLRINIRNATNTYLDIKENPYVKIPIRKVDTDTYHSFFGENIPPLKDEKFVGNINNHRGQLIIQIYAKPVEESWTRLCYYLNGYEWFGEQLGRYDRFLRKQVEPVISGVTDSLEIAKRVDRYVKNRMNWNEYFSRGSENVREAFNKQEGTAGDINLIYVCILRSLGFEAYPMLVASKNLGWVLYPRLNSFNSLLAAVKINGEWYLLDGTLDKGTFGQIQLYYANDNGLIVFEDNGSLLYPTMIQELSKQNYIIDAEFNLEDLKIAGNAKKQMTHYYALDFREHYNELKGDVYTMEKDEIDFLTIKNFKMENIQDYDKPLLASYDFEYEDAIEVIGNQVYFSPLLYLGYEENVFNEVNRLYPIDISKPYAKNIIINFTIPEGYTINSSPNPRNYKIGEDIGWLRYNTSLANNKLQILLNLSLNKQLIPAEYYEGLKQVFVELTNITKEKIALTKN